MQTMQVAALFLQHFLAVKSILGMGAQIRPESANL
eukprot:COSAG02_NODE_846_length_16565_cov_20.404627_7_plen_35_part_00